MPVRIRQSQSITDVLEYADGSGYNKRIFVFDLDATLLRPASEVGTEKWVSEILDLAVSNFDGDPQVAKQLAFELCDQIQSVIHMEEVEHIVTHKVIDFLQRSGATVLFITARNPEIIDITMRQLHEANIFPEQGEILEPSDSSDSEMSDSESDSLEFDLPNNRKFHFQNNVISCCGGNKGEYLFHYLQHLGIELTQDDIVVMADDTERHLVSMKKVIKERSAQSTFVGFRYGFFDSRVQHYNKLQAQVELKRVYNHLSDHIQNIIDQLKLVDDMMELEDEFAPGFFCFDDCHDEIVADYHSLK